MKDHLEEGLLAPVSSINSNDPERGRMRGASEDSGGYGSCSAVTSARFTTFSLVNGGGDGFDSAIESVDKIFCEEIVPLNLQPVPGFIGCRRLLDIDNVLFAILSFFGLTHLSVASKYH